MKIGVCGGILGDTYKYAQKIGFDYFEVNFRTVVNETETEVNKMIKEIEKRGLPVETSNGLFFNEQSFFGENGMSLEEIDEYLERGFSKIKKIGVKTVVWGAGPTRKVPDTEDMEKAKEKIEKIAHIIGDKAEKYDFDIAIEPLCRNETNIMNTVKSAYEFSQKIDRKKIKVLADSFHMMAESEAYNTLKNSADRLIHAHIAEAVFGSSEVRLTPDSKDENNVREFVEELKKIGYDGRISIEAALRTGDWYKDMEEALKAIRSWI